MVESKESQSIDNFAFNIQFEDLILLEQPYITYILLLLKSHFNTVDKIKWGIDEKEKEEERKSKQGNVFEHLSAIGKEASGIKKKLQCYRNILRIHFYSKDFAKYNCQILIQNQKKKRNQENKKALKYEEWFNQYYYQ
ncbi:unnamed protein product (macronuclear) [Paramecium tetraurelia]|uniref:Uncharacterized protein n=1 Tax=Paramecium tetraurelia TaxID=5888 RepID=A0EBK0_PARTE|nr:uncharacterized protein GSPATT00025401001 [Paramecium tetraurelia]CAK92667.1 unnamed protein product [Paramecium tetraurelia]|eukprot:XP_001460064.1 hypothetical protein (macronuclear) [Paramecium tetraurelia strain d4-2]